MYTSLLDVISPDGEKIIGTVAAVIVVIIVAIIALGIFLVIRAERKNRQNRNDAAIGNTEEKQAVTSEKKE